MLPQGVEEEEEAEQYSDEETPVVVSEPKPPAADGTTQGEDKEDEEEAAETQGEGQSKEESKTEEKGNLAGERQSGDGQVRLASQWISHKRDFSFHCNWLWWYEAELLINMFRKSCQLLLIYGQIHKYCIFLQCLLSKSPHWIKYSFVVCAAASLLCLSVTGGRAQLVHTE